MTKGHQASNLCSTRHRVDGNGSILDFGYLGIVYEILDYSSAGARLRGPMPPPGVTFDVLLHVSGRFIECRARLLPDDLKCGGCLCVALESFREPAFLRPPRRLENRREIVAVTSRCNTVAPQPRSVREELRARTRQRIRRESDICFDERALAVDDDRQK